MSNKQKGNTQQWQILITCIALITTLMISAVITYVVMHSTREKPIEFQRSVVSGSVRIQEINGRLLEWSENMQDMDGKTYNELRKSVEKIFMECLSDVNAEVVKVSKFREDDFSHILKIPGRGLVVEWTAEIVHRGDGITEESVADRVMNCKNDIILEPESVQVGDRLIAESRTFSSLESYLMNNEDEYDLRNIEFPTVTVPKFLNNQSCLPLEANKSKLKFKVANGGALQVMSKGESSLLDFLIMRLDPEYGSVVPLSCKLGDHITVGLTCKFSCSSNKTMIGDSSVTCLSTGSWSFPPPTCSSYCFPLAPVINGGIYPSSCKNTSFVRPGTRCFYYCDPYFVLDGSSVSCTSNGEWKGIIPLCKKTCSPLSLHKEGKVSPDECTDRRSPVDFVCSFTCNKGYTVSGNPSLTCDVDGNWNTPAPSCRRGCNLLQEPAHGSVHPPACTSRNEDRSEVMEGMVCVHSCDENYVLEGTTQRLCDEGGIWTGKEVICKHLCSPMRPLPYMNVVPQSCSTGMVIEGTRCELVCQNQYMLFGLTNSKVCLETGDWSALDVACLRTCPNLQPSLNGLVEPMLCNGEEPIPEGAECSITCSEGFHLLGASSITCGESGKWSGSLGKCLKKCSSLVIPMYVHVRPINCSINEVFQETRCHFGCAINYGMEGSSSLLCLADGTWSGSVPTCSVESQFMIRQTTSDHDVCLAVNVFTLRVNKYNFESCETLNQMQWWATTSSGAVKNVGSQKCLAVSSPKIGSFLEAVDCDSNNENQKWYWVEDDHFVSLRLESHAVYPSFGFVSVASVTLTEKKDQYSEWYSMSPDNVLNQFGLGSIGDCPKLTISSAQIVTPDTCISNTTVKNGTICKFSCSVGYKLHGPGNRTCRESRWDNFYPACKRSCLPLFDPRYGNVTLRCKEDLQDTGSLCTFQCDHLHKLVGHEQTTCLSHGEWSYPQPDCQEVCLPLLTVPNGLIEPADCTVSQSLIGTVCSLKCTFPFFLQGYPERICSSNSRWSRDWACVRGCEAPTALENGNVVCTSNPVWEGNTCTYTCDSQFSFAEDGLPVDGNVVRECQSDGLFNGSIPICRSTCPVFQRPFSSRVSPSSCTMGKSLSNTVCSVRCLVGYRFTGISPMVTCLPDGKWSSTDSTCESETQFLLFNKEEDPPVCIFVNEPANIGSMIHKTFLNYIECILPGHKNLWAWNGDRITHVYTQLCLAVKDIETRSFSVLILKTCDTEDDSQNWVCENDSILKLAFKSLYLTAGNTRNIFATAVDPLGLSEKDFHWFAKDFRNFMLVERPCVMNKRNCPPIKLPEHSMVAPLACELDEQINGSSCTVSCDAGYLLNVVEENDITLVCLAHGIWNSTASVSKDAFPLSCKIPCPALEANDHRQIIPEDKCTSGKSLFGTACTYSCDPGFSLSGPRTIVCMDDGTWSEMPPMCLVKCFHNVTNHNSSSLSQYTNYSRVHDCIEDEHEDNMINEGVQCRYSCDNQFHRLNGPSVRTCTSSGYFDHILEPLCEFPHLGAASVARIALCPQAPGMPDSIFSCFFQEIDPHTERICAKYSCDNGYKLIGFDTIHCDILTNTWPYPPQCKKICSLDVFNCADLYEGQICHAVCPDYHKLSHGNGILLCRSDGSWNDTIPTCVSELDMMINSVEKVGSFDVDICLLPSVEIPSWFNSWLIVSQCSGATTPARWRWYHQYNIQHTASSLCLGAGSLRHASRLRLLPCNPMDPLQLWQCSTDFKHPMHLVAKEKPSLVIVTEQALLSITYDFYYTYLADKTVVSEDKLAEAKWFLYPYWQSTVCAKRPNKENCPPLYSVLPSNGHIVPSSCVEEWASEGQQCSWICSVGLLPYVSGTTSTTCLHSGLWMTTSFKCERLCPPLSRPKNGSVMECELDTTLPQGAVCHLKCDAGYQPSGEKQRVCQWDGTWSGEEFQCTKTCSPLLPLQNAMISPSECTIKGEVGMVCTYSCNTGYHMPSKEPSRTCLSDGHWSGEKPACIRVCPPLPKVDHGVVSPVVCTSTYLPTSSVCVIQCEGGYGIVGNDTRECLADGSWSNSLRGDSKTVCQSQCKPLTPPRNGHIECFLNDNHLTHYTSFYMESTECKISCNIEYALEGSWLRRCEVSGVWSGKSSFCIEETQFMIFMSKTLIDEQKSTKICLSADRDGTVIKVNAAECDFHNPSHRWSWYAGAGFKSASTGGCMGISTPRVGQQLILKNCNGTDHLQMWSCTGPLQHVEWFLRLSEHDLYPDYGYKSVKQIWVYDLHSYETDVDDVMWYSEPVSNEISQPSAKRIRKTLCAMRELAGGICSPLSSPENGEVFPEVCLGPESSIVSGLMCSFKCNVGYQLGLEEKTITCQTNGVWSGPAVTCNRYCPAFSPIPHILIHPTECIVSDEEDSDTEYIGSSGILSGGLCVVTCEDGYKLEHGSEMRLTCLEHGEWSDKVPDCKRVCSNLIPGDNIIASPASCFNSDRIEGDVCMLKCEEGYGLKVIDPSCSIDVPASVLLNITNSTMTNSSSASNEIECSSELAQSHMFDHVIRMCLDDGSWSGKDVECLSMCNPLVPPKYGKIMPLSCSSHYLMEGTSCVYECDTGFAVDGTPSKTCMHGSWVLTASLTNETEPEQDQNRTEPIFHAERAPSCERYCEPLVRSNNQTSITPSTCLSKFVPVGTACMMECDSNFVLKGDVETICFPDGTWSGVQAVCIEKCPALKPLENGKIMPLACVMANMGSGAVCTFSCSEKYSLVGSVTTMCSASGNWTSEVPECRRRCFPLSKLYNGVAEPPLSCFGDYIMAGDSCMFACYDGFIISGSSIAKCGADGEWDTAVPKCKKLCPVPQVKNATVECTLPEQTGRGFTDYTWGTVCKTICASGLSPSSMTTSVCDSRGNWNPRFPDCIETGIPMYIMQNLDSSSICLSESPDGNVIKISKRQCLQLPKSMKTNPSQWHWLGNFNIQNFVSGRCMSIYNVRTDEPLVTTPCDTKDPLQWWECSTENPFRLLLRDTAYSPSTYVQNSDTVVLQLWSEANSYFTTLSLNTLTLSSLCSRRPGGACPTLRDIEGGTVEPAIECKSNTVTEGQMCGFKCTSQHALLLGEGVTMCMGNGIWMYPLPKCIETCPMLVEDLPPATYYEDPACVFDDPQTDQICTAGCLDGFEMRGNPNRTCLPNGSWSAREFECRKMCQVIFGILDGKIDPVPCRSVACLFSCNPGFVLGGARVLICEANGEWDKDIPQCIRDAQFQIISMDMPICITVDDDNAGLLTKSKCEQENGGQLFKWIQDSDLLQHTETGLCVTGRTSKWGNVALELCDEENRNQVWNCGVGAKSKLNSLNLENEAGSKFYLDLGAEVDVFLQDDNNGQSLDAKRLVMEMEYYPTSYWMARHYFSQGTVCSMKDRKQCPPFPIPLNGTVSPDECKNHMHIREGLVCVVTCNTGYSTEARTHSTCLQDGTWSDPLPVCKGMYQCDALTLKSPSVEVLPVSCSQSDINEGATCHFSCNEGYHLFGPSQIDCLQEGIWSDNPPVCIQACKPIPPLENGWMEPIWCLGGTNLPDVMCTIHCNENFQLSGPGERFCKASGEWSGTDAKCTRYCGKLQSPASGNIYPDRCKSDNNYEDNVCQFHCNPGFILKGQTSLVCINGEWNGLEPHCVPLHACPSLEQDQECEMDIVYNNLLNGEAVTLGTTVTVICGEHCQLESGPVTRKCSSTGQWDHGQPLCKKLCPPIIPTIGILLRPNNCSYDYHIVGSHCSAACLSSEHPTEDIICMTGGLWSAVPSECEISEDRDEFFASDEDLSKAFMIRQFYPDDTHICLQADVVKGCVLQVPASSCSEYTTSQTWTWLNFRLIQSVSSGFCWTPVAKEGGVILGLVECDMHDSSQVFTCGDIELQQYTLHLEAEKLEVWNNGSSVAKLTSSVVKKGLDWEAVSLSENSYSVFQSNVNMSYMNSICRQMCGSIFTNYSGVFESPGHPSPYRTNMVCEWIIKVNSRKILLWLHHVDIGDGVRNENGKCAADNLLILDGDENSLENSNILGRICGKWEETLGPFIALRGKMLIRFFSDADTVSSGFIATWDTEPYPKPLTSCGIKPNLGGSGRLIGGLRADINDIPWYASVISLQGHQHICSAAFIHTRFLITAAHCLQNINQDSVSYMVVGYGSSSQRSVMNLVREILTDKSQEMTSVSADDGAKLVRIKNVIVHPDFDDSMSNDVAIIEISEEATLPDSNSVACLPRAYVPADTFNHGWVESAKMYCTVAGWDTEKSGGTIQLHSVSLPIMSDQHCGALSSNAFGRHVNTSITLCAGHFDGTQQSLCDGDDGSALICEWNGNYYSVGIASFQIAPCGKLNIPKYFTRISVFSDWLSNHMSQNN